MRMTTQEWVAIFVGRGHALTDRVGKMPEERQKSQEAITTVIPSEAWESPGGVLDFAVRTRRLPRPAASQ